MIEYEIMVDWDSEQWSDTPTFAGDDDISNDVAYMDLNRGKEKEEGNSPASYLQIKMKAGLHQKYCIYNPASSLYERLRIWLPVRVRARYDGINWKPVFFGYISSIKVNPNPNKQEVILYITDGLDLLARQIIKQNDEEKTAMSPGDAINQIANAAGWSASRRTVDTAEAAMISYPETGVY
jgi:hypothetical protein